MSPMRQRKFWSRSGAALVLCFLWSGCTEPNSVDNDTTNTIVVIDTLQAASAGSSTVTGDDLFSDVCDDATTTSCVAVNDNGVVQMRAHLKDPSALSGNLNAVEFTRYHVTYVRADGRNVPGVDVPYPFDGAATFRVPADGTTVNRTFMVVRQQAKIETPLRELRTDKSAVAGAGGALILSTLAQIDFYGTDLAGRAIQVTGHLNITFGDF